MTAPVVTEEEINAFGVTSLICSTYAETISYLLRSSLMKQKQHSIEEIIRILRQAEANQTVEDVC